MPYVMSRQVLDEILRSRGVKPNDLKGIDTLFGGADGYYWYHTMRHMCPGGEVHRWATEDEIRRALQDHENETAAEDEVKPQVVQDAHVAAIAKLLAS